MLVLLQDPGAGLPSRMDSCRPLQAASRESQVYQHHGHHYRAADGYRGFSPEWWIRSILEKDTADLDDSGATDEQCRRRIFSSGNQSDETAGWLRALGRAAALDRLPRIAPPGTATKNQHRTRADFFTQAKVPKFYQAQLQPALVAKDREHDARDQ